MEEYRLVGAKKLRCGFTTGSCAAAAAKAAALLLLSGRQLQRVGIEMPNGTEAELLIHGHLQDEGEAMCGVLKDAGDDPDITNGALIMARVSKTALGITVEGGEGVGRVTREGLSCNVGEAAINPVPRRMIAQAVLDACSLCGYTGGLYVEIIIPQGAELAKKTYNPRLGIVGGLSVLGTSGIVEPMSEQALVDTIKVEMDVLKASGAKFIVLTPGNYGEAYIQNILKIGEKCAVKYSNFLGEALDYAVALNFDGVLLVGHLGKLVKLAGGVFQTHSRYADCRMEVLAAHAALAGAARATVSELMGCVTTDEAWGKIEAVGLCAAVSESLMQKIAYHLRTRAGECLKTGAVVFSNKYGTIGITENAKELIAEVDII
ncbi:MAG: cobalt-precorrin-5B (C(1))-methyltransferase CbiD [Hydrogenoanaerobacterium sp.]